MNLRINGLRAGVMATLLAVGGAGCKRAPYKPMPKEMVTQDMERVVDSFYKVGLKYENNPNYGVIHWDTIRLRDSYIEKPRRLQAHLNFWASHDQYPCDEGDISFLYFYDPTYVVSDNTIYADEKNRAYIAVKEYDLIK